MSLTITERSVTHATFTIERIYPASPDKVFDAFADPEKKRRWFAEGEGFEIETYDLNFQAGGIEHARFRVKDGKQFTNNTVFQDIVAGQRIVFAYTMSMNGQCFSASLTTVELLPEGNGTKLKFTEQAAFFEGADGAKMREAGWNSLLDSLGKKLG